MTWSVFEMNNVSSKVHRKAIFTPDGDLPGASLTTVITVRSPGSLVFQWADNNWERLEAFGQAPSCGLSCKPTDVFDCVGVGFDEGISLLAQIAVSFSDASTLYFCIASSSTHIPFDVLVDELSVSFRHSGICAEHKSRKQNRHQDLHDFLLKRRYKRWMEHGLIPNKNLFRLIAKN